MIEIKKVETKKELKSFIDFPHDLYAGDPNYVPEIFIAQKDLLTPGKHPFHNHSKLQAFLAYDNGKIKGRVAAILNNNHNAFVNAKDGFFGFYDCVNDLDISNKLLSTAQQWLKEHHAETMIGPVNPSTNETCGLLVEGFETPPVIMMTYNKPYYQTLLENFGLKKQVDLLAYNIPSASVDKRAIALKERIRQRLESRNIVVRTINLKNFWAEVENILDVYNAAWKDNTGFVPMTNEEFKYSAKDMKMLLDQDFCLVAEQNGKAVGFALALPNINQVLKKVKRGRLFPTGIFKILLGKGKIDYLRVLALGVNEDCRKLGIEAWFYAEIIEKAIKKNIKGAEGSWILENNEMMNKGLQNLNATVNKRYRLFEKTI